jgi:hypothetical protein
MALHFLPGLAWTAILLKLPAAGTTEKCHDGPACFVVEMRSHLLFVRPQVGLQLLPISASQVAGIIGMNYCAWPSFYFLNLYIFFFFPVRFVRDLRTNF